MVDLHTHSYFSDGNFSPTEVVKNAYDKGVRVLALTDHDTLDGIPEFLEVSKKYSDLKAIVGCETSSNFNDYNPDKEVHILALNIKKQDNFKKFIKKASNIRKDGCLARLEMLRKAGYNIQDDDVLKNNVGTLTNQDIVKIAIKLGVVKSKEEFSSDTDSGESKSPFKKGGIAYHNIYKLFPNANETIPSILESGAFAILAHPYKLKLENDDLLKYITELKSFGLSGIECYHSNHSLEQTDLYIKIAKELNLLITGGSDHHGKPEQTQKEYGMSNKLQIKIPIEIGNIFND